MENNDCIQCKKTRDRQGFLKQLSHIPHKILHHQEQDNLQQTVLHDLCDSFGIRKAGYFIDNPDFNCMKGVGGYCREDFKAHKTNVWQDPLAFQQYLKDAQFNQTLTRFMHDSFSKEGKEGFDESELRVLGEQLGLCNPACMHWKMRHGNHGILLYEDDDDREDEQKELFKNFAALLSLC